MNRYATNGLVADALAGKTILVLTPQTALIRAAMDEILRGPLDDADLDAYEVRRTSGAQRIEFASGGRILFQSARSTPRGMTADVVFLVDDAWRHISTEGWRDLQHVAAAGEIIRA